MRAPDFRRPVLTEIQILAHGYWLNDLNFEEIKELLEGKGMHLDQTTFIRGLRIAEKRFADRTGQHAVVPPEPHVRAGEAWSEDEVQALKDRVLDGDSPEQIAVNLQRTYQEVETKINRLKEPTKSSAVTISAGSIELVFDDGEDGDCIDESDSVAGSNQSPSNDAAPKAKRRKRHDLKPRKADQHSPVSCVAPAGTRTAKKERGVKNTTTSGKAARSKTISPDRATKKPDKTRRKNASKTRGLEKPSKRSAVPEDSQSQADTVATDKASDATNDLKNSRSKTTRKRTHHPTDLPFIPNV